MGVRWKLLHGFLNTVTDSKGIIPAEFDRFDELMRIDYRTLDRVCVNFSAIPFGHDNTPTGIYRVRDGDPPATPTLLPAFVLPRFLDNTYC